MKKLSLALAFLIILAPFSKALAHRSGCHRWHSCPSDTGSYVCGDLGYTSGCTKVMSETPKATSKTSASSVKKTTSVKTPVVKKEKVWVNGYYRKDGTYVKGYWRN